MKRLIITLLFSATLLTENLNAIPTPSNDRIQLGPTTVTPKAPDTSIIVDLEPNEDSTASLTHRNTTLEFERSYYNKCGKVAFVFQRISRFTKFACMTTSSILSAFAIWNEQNVQSSTAFSTTAIILNGVGILSAGIDIYATGFLKEAEDLH